MPHCRILNRYFNILLVLFFALVVSSCAKEDLESPAQTPAPKAIMKTHSEVDKSFKTPDKEKLPPTPVYINDDGDEEDEGLKPSLPTVIKD